MERGRVLSFDMGSRNLAFALIESPSTVLRMGMIDLLKHAAREATEALVETLMTNNKWMLEEECPIVIELQPRAGICKVLSHVIQGVVNAYDLDHGRIIRKVKFMHAMQKFKFDPIFFANSDPQTYAERKQCAVDIARTILQKQDNTRFLEFFESQSYKQQTDLADAVLQGCRQNQI